MNDDPLSYQNYLDDLINRTAQKHGVDPAIAHALVHAESNFNPNVDGPPTKYGRAQGLTQLIPSTAKEMGVTDPHDPEQNIEGGLGYYAKMKAKYKTDDAALAAYNWGPGNYDKHLKGQAVMPAETQKYKAKILAEAGKDDPLSYDNYLKSQKNTPQQEAAQKKLAPEQKTPQPSPFDYKQEPGLTTLGKQGEYKEAPESFATRQLKNVGQGLKGAAANYAKDFAALSMGNPANIGQAVATYRGATQAQEGVPEDQSTLGKTVRGVTQGIAEAPKYIAAGMTGPFAGPILGGAALVEGNLVDHPVETLTNAGVQAILPGVAGKLAPSLGKIFGKAAPAVTPGLLNVGAGYVTRKAERALGVDVPDTTMGDVATEFITGSALGAKEIYHSIHPAAGRTGNTDNPHTADTPPRPQAIGIEEQAKAASRSPYEDWSDASLMLERDSHVRDLDAALKDKTTVFSSQPGAEPTPEESGVVDRYMKARDGLAAVNAEILKRDQIKDQQAAAWRDYKENPSKIRQFRQSQAPPEETPVEGPSIPGYQTNSTTVEMPEGGWSAPQEKLNAASPDAGNINVTRGPNVQAGTPVTTGAASVGVQLPENWARMAWDRQMAQGADPAETLTKIQAVDPNFQPPGEQTPAQITPGAETPKPTEDVSETWPTYQNAAEIGTDITGSPQAGTPTATVPSAVSPVRQSPVKPKTPFGSFWSDLHKGPTKGGGDSFFQDQNVKSALGLLPESSSKDVQKAIKEEMSGTRGVTSEDISSANISPAELFAWARTKGLDKNPDTWNKINWAAYPDKRNEITFNQPSGGTETETGNAESGNPDELQGDTLAQRLQASITKEASGGGKKGRGRKSSQPEEPAVSQEAPSDVHETVSPEDVVQNAGTPQAKGLKAFRREQGPTLRDLITKKSMGPSEPIPEVVDNTKEMDEAIAKYKTDHPDEYDSEGNPIEQTQATEPPARPDRTVKEVPKPKKLSKVQELKARKAALEGTTKADIEAAIASGEIGERHAGLPLAGKAGRAAKRFAQDLNDTARATQMIGHFTAPFKQGAYYSWARPEDMTKTWGNMAKGWIKGQDAHDATFSTLSQTHSAEVGRQAGIYHAGEADLQHQIADLKRTLHDGYGVDRRDINDVTGSVDKAGYADLKQAKDVLDGWVKRLKDSGRSAKGTLESQEDYVKRRNTLEETQQSRLLESIPGLKQLFGASKRGFNGFLDTQRQLVWDSFVKTQEAQGRTFETHPQMYKDMAKVINSRTGRGDLGGLNKYSEFLGDAFYSPRYIKSRIELLDPRFYAGKKFDPEVNKQNRKDAVKLIRNGTAVFAALKGLGALTGTPVDFGTNPDESDFGKLKIGDRVVQVFSGAEDIARLIARTSMAIHGEEGDDSYWEADEDEKIARNKKAMGVIGRFVRSKLGPGASVIVDASVGRDYMGKKATLGHEISKSFTPFPAADIVQAIIEDETPDYVSSLPSMFGLRTYKKEE